MSRIPDTIYDMEDCDRLSIRDISFPRKEVWTSLESISESIIADIEEAKINDSTFIASFTVLNTYKVALEKLCEGKLHGVSEADGLAALGIDSRDIMVTFEYTTEYVSAVLGEIDVRLRSKIIEYIVRLINFKKLVLAMEKNITCPIN